MSSVLKIHEGELSEGLKKLSDGEQRIIMIRFELEGYAEIWNIKRNTLEITNINNYSDSNTFSVLDFGSKDSLNKLFKEGFGYNPEDQVEIFELM